MDVNDLLTWGWKRSLHQILGQIRRLSKTVKTQKSKWYNKNHVKSQIPSKCNNLNSPYFFWLCTFNCLFFPPTQWGSLYLALIYGKKRSWHWCRSCTASVKNATPPSQYKTTSFISKTINFQSVIETNVASDRMGWYEIRGIGGKGDSLNRCKAYLMSRHDEKWHDFSGAFTG